MKRKTRGDREREMERLRKKNRQSSPHVCTSGEYSIIELNWQAGNGLYYSISGSPSQFFQSLIFWTTECRLNLCVLERMSLRLDDVCVFPCRIYFRWTFASAVCISQFLTLCLLSRAVQTVNNHLNTCHGFQMKQCSCGALNLHINVLKATRHSLAPRHTL